MPICASIPSRPQRGEHLVTPVDPDDVRLPPVPIAVRRAGQLDDPGEPLGVPGGDALARLEQLVEPLELRDAEGAEHVGEAVVETGLRDVEVAVR